MNAGVSNTGSANSFFGRGAGFNNLGGDHNSFFGNQAGNANTASTDNSFFGFEAGKNSVGISNSFSRNSFFGSQSGKANTMGYSNSFFGGNSGLANTDGFANSFFGESAGNSNTTGFGNTIIGASAGVGSGDLSYATAIGAEARVDTSDTIVLGRSAGSDTVVVPGKLQVDTLGTAGATNLCINGSNRIASCSSSLRYKTDVQSFTGGLDIVRHLRPISFVWKDNLALHDVGFGAEEVEQIEPLLATYNKTGQIEGVKYGQITTVLVNSVNEQQTEIEQLQQLIKLQKQQIEALKKLVCGQNPQAEICKEREE